MKSWNSLSEDERAKRESNLDHNLGSNWRDIYDPVERKYINGYNPNNLTEGRIGISKSTGYDIGSRGSSGGTGGIYGGNAYQRLLEQQKRARKDEYDRGIGNINKSATEASRHAYINRMQSMERLPQQTATLGAGGTSETAMLGLETGYGKSLAEIEAAKLAGVSELEGQYQQGIAIDEANALAYQQQLAEQKRQEALAYKNKLEDIARANAQDEKDWQRQLQLKAMSGSTSNSNKTLSPNEIYNLAESGLISQSEASRLLSQVYGVNVNTLNGENDSAYKPNNGIFGNIVDGVFKTGSSIVNQIASNNPEKRQNLLNEIAIEGSKFKNRRDAINYFNSLLGNTITKNELDYVMNIF